MTISTIPKRKRFERSDDPPPLRMTERDRAILRAVHTYRMLTCEQIQKLLFPGARIEVPRTRLRKLYHHRYLERIPIPASASPLAGYMPVYRLARLGAALIAFEQQTPVAALKYWGQGDDRDGRQQASVTTPFIAHELAMNDVRIAFTLAAKAHGYAIATWHDEPTLRGFKDSVSVVMESGRPHTVAVIPDAYCLLELPDRRAHFCLELDRSTMTTARFQQKIQAYQAYLASGQFSARFHAQRVRILTIAPSLERLQNLQQKTEEAGGSPIYWFTTLDAVVEHDPLHDLIWTVAGRGAERSPLIA
ncbi:MAG: replication-relaxation family protein [Chloroflexi bacterium]|nr:replication-relaxation family protein [Chloroflexota bacterium]MBI3734101.1 replication-relaxation family protein [Chloroflexota bacterium]